MPVHRGYTFNHQHSASLEELAGQVWLKSKVSPGIGFARKEVSKKISTGNEKGKARLRVVETFSAFCVKGETFNILSMPGLYWKFERALAGYTGSRGRNRYFSVENEAAIFRASVEHMLGFRHYEGFGMADPFTMYSKYVHEYKLMDIETYVDVTPHNFDVAWLDFTGFITPRRTEAIKSAFRKTSKALVVTLLEARQSKVMTRKINAAGGIENYLSAAVGMKAIDVYRYVDVVPMVQITWNKQPDFCTQVQE